MAGGALGQLARQLHPLGLAPRQRGGGLAEAHVAEPDVGQGAHVAGDGRLVGEELPRVGARHVENLGDVAALEGHLQGVAVVALALAQLAGHVHVGQEVHLDADGAVTPAGLAAPALHVEREPSRHVAANAGLGGVGEQLADVVKNPGVGGRVGPGGAAYGRLVDGDHLVEVADAVDAGVAPGRGLGPVDVLHQGPVQDLVDERRLARPRHPGHAHELLKREGDVDVGQVVLPGAADHQAGAVAEPAHLRHLDAAPARQVLAGDGILHFEQALQRPGVHDGPAVLARARPDVHHMVGDPDRLLVVLHHHHGVAQVAHSQQRLDEAAVVALVKPYRRLVEHVQHPDEA